MIEKLIFKDTPHYQVTSKINEIIDAVNNITLTLSKLDGSKAIEQHKKEVSEFLRNLNQKDG